MIKKYQKHLQLVLANELGKTYSDCTRSEKNKINSKIKERLQKFESVPYIINDSNFELRNYIKLFIQNKILNNKKLLSRDKITYRWFVANSFNKEYNYIFYTTFYLKNTTISERIYHIMNDIFNSYNYCENCKNTTLFLDYSRGYRRFCSISCSKNEKELKRIGVIKEFTSWTTEKKQYYSLVRRYTNKSLKEYDINPDNLPIGRNGSGEVYQVDHKISINYGFKNNIEPSIIGSIDNLQLLHWKLNNKKSDRNCL